MNYAKSSWKFTKEEKEKIVKLWLNGGSTISIAKKFGCNDEAIRLIVRYRIPKEKYNQTVREHMKKFEEKRKIKPIKNPKMSQDLAWWVGVVKGDGHVNFGNNFVRLAVKDKCLRDRWSFIGYKLFNIKPTFRITLYGLYQAQFSSKLLVNFLEKNFGYFGHYVWDIPNSIKNSSDDIKLGFIRGLFDAEGCVKNPTHCELTFASVNHKAVESLKIMLQEIGIFSKIRIEKRKETGRVYTVLRICGYQDMIKFTKNINFTIERKSLRLSDYINYISQKGYYDTSRIFGRP